MKPLWIKPTIDPITVQEEVERAHSLAYSAWIGLCHFCGWKEHEGICNA